MFGRAYVNEIFPNAKSCTIDCDVLAGGIFKPCACKSAVKPKITNSNKIVLIVIFMIVFFFFDKAKHKPLQMNR